MRLPSTVFVRYLSALFSCPLFYLCLSSAFGRAFMRTFFVPQLTFLINNWNRSRTCKSLAYGIWSIFLSCMTFNLKVLEENREWRHKRAQKSLYKIKKKKKSKVGGKIQAVFFLQSAVIVRPFAFSSRHQNTQLPVIWHTARFFFAIFSNKSKQTAMAEFPNSKQQLLFIRWKRTICNWGQHSSLCWFCSYSSGSEWDKCVYVYTYWSRSWNFPHCSLLMHH